MTQNMPKNKCRIKLCLENSQIHIKTRDIESIFCRATRQYHNESISEDEEQRYSASFDQCYA
jgi:hypothetical protein